MTYWLAKKTVLVKLIFFYLTKHAQYTKKVFFDLQKTTMNSKIPISLIRNKLQ